MPSKPIFREKHVYYPLIFGYRSMKIRKLLNTFVRRTFRNYRQNGFELSNDPVVAFMRFENYKHVIFEIIDNI